MNEYALLQGQRVLIVDDEPDVLETSEALLSMCNVTKATSFGDGKNLLETRPFDVAVLDIMGVDGFKLLDIANRKGVATVMLTAHSVNPESIVRAFNGGAASYLPKEKMEDLPTFLEEILESRAKGESYRRRWLNRLESYWGKRFGPDWKATDKDFWDKFPFYG